MAGAPRTWVLKSTPDNRVATAERTLSDADAAPLTERMHAAAGVAA